MSEKLILFFSMDNLDIRTQNEIYNEFYYLVYDTVFYIIRDPASVEDMIHESLLKAIDSPPEYVDPNKIKGWLKAIARNHCLNYVRKHKKKRDKLDIQQVNEHDITDFFNNDSSIEQQVFDKLSVEEIMEEMHGLRPEYKQVLILKYIHDLNSNEITEIVGVPAPTIRQWIFRTKEAIKKSLKKKSGDLYETR